MQSSDKPTRCPFCREENEAVTNVTGKRMPRDGDFSFCFQCGEWAIFDSHWSGGVRRPTHAEYEDIVASPIMQTMRAKWLDVKERNTSHP